MKKIVEIDSILFSFLCLVFFTITSVIFKIYMFIIFHDAFFNLDFSLFFESMLYGFKFDLSISSILSLPLITFFIIRNLQRKCVGLVWSAIPFFFLLFGLFGDLVYLENTGKHVGYEIHQILRDAKELALNFIFGYKVYAGVLAFSVSVFLLITYNKAVVFKGEKKWIYCCKLLFIYISFLFFARGALFDTPLTPNMAYRIGNIDAAKLSLNGAYAALYSLIKSDRKTTIDYTQKWNVNSDQIDNVFHDKKLEFKPITNRKNVVVVLLESWSGQYIHSVNPDAENITPYFDSLSKNGLSTEAMFAGGVRTHEGMYSVLCSQQNPLGSGIPETFLQSYSYKCLPEILRDAGLHVSMFQGSHTKLVGDFALFLGAHESFGKLDIPFGRLEQNYWGYQDPDLYDFVINKAKKEKQPFFYIINTTTTHDLVLPNNVEWAFGRHTNEEKRKSVLHYADESLKYFVNNWVKEIKEPTLFVFVADHTAGGASDQIHQFVIPFTMYATDGTVNKYKEMGISSQRDIAPTIIDNLGGYVPWFSGSILGKKNDHYSDFYSNGYLGFAYNKNIASVNIFDTKKTKCYEWTDNIFKSHITSCDSSLIEKGLIFTKHSQSLLFSGKTMNFHKGYKDES